MYEMVNCGVVEVFFTNEGTFASVDGLQKLFDVYQEDTDGDEIRSILDEKEIKTEFLDDKDRKIECAELFNAMWAVQFLKKAKNFKITACNLLLRTIFQKLEVTVYNITVEKTMQKVLQKLNNQDEKEKTLMAVGRLLNDRRDKMIRQIESGVQTKED